MAVLLDGKKVALEIKNSIRDEVRVCEEKYKKRPVLACVAVGENPASSVYVKSQMKVAEDLGIAYRLVSLPGSASQEDLVSDILKLNADPLVNGIIIQSPLPKGMDMRTVVGFILPAKDAEGMHPQNLGAILLGEEKIAPCTARACMTLLRHYQIKLYGKEAVVVGHSEIVGKPLSLMLLKEFATTTVCHIGTSEANKLVDHVKRAEVLIVAVGKANLIRGDWVKEGAVVVDVGINRVGDKILGDVEFETAEKKASYITPVPGGVGPLTVAMLMKNTLELFKEAIR